MVDSNNSPIQKINYFKVDKYLEAIRYTHFICSISRVIYDIIV